LGGSHDHKTTSDAALDPQGRLGGLGVARRAGLSAPCDGSDADQDRHPDRDHRRLCAARQPGDAHLQAGQEADRRQGLPERLELFTQFPFTPTGKIQRHALVRQVLTRMSN
jgi:hypothetical protein